MRSYWRETGLGLVVVGLVLWVGIQAYQMRPGGKAPEQSPNAVICAACGWRGEKINAQLPATCPECGETAVHFAGICPECGEWTPWDAGREEILFFRPRLFMDWGPGWFFPECHDCGTETNAKGRHMLPPELLERIPGQGEAG
ncbi:MAG: hypothetical protein GF320_21965 [Armatimonadia bacterium]|nr:hypothetical protein [Armatimonadia bacterium]